VLDHNRLLRYLAVGLAVLRTVDAARVGRLVPDLEALADVLDAEALRDGPTNEVFHNPAKALAARMRERRVVLVGDSPAAAEIARHGAEVLVQATGHIVAATDLAEVVAAAPRLAEAAGGASPDLDPLFHDEQLDGPSPVEQVRVFVVSADQDRPAARRRLAVFGAGARLVDAELITADAEPMSTEGGMPRPRRDIDPAAGQPNPPTGQGGELEQLAVLTLRLEMAAAYLHLLDHRPPDTDPRTPYDERHY
jgi:hypothetical protein